MIFAGSVKLNEQSMVVLSAENNFLYYICNLVLYFPKHYSKKLTERVCVINPPNYGAP